MNERLRAHFVRPALALLVLGLVLVGNKNPAHSAGPSNATYAHLADSGPSARQSMGMANDATTGQIVLFGGYVFSEDQLAADTWAWDGSAWTQQNPADSPSARC